MAELDAEEVRIRTDVGTAPPADWHDELALIRELPSVSTDPDARPEDRRALAEAAFESVDALGARQVAFTMAPQAGGAQAMAMVGARGFEPPTS